MAQDLILPTLEQDGDVVEWAGRLVATLQDALVPDVPFKTGMMMGFPAGQVAEGWLETTGLPFDEKSFPELALKLGSNILPDIESPFGVGTVVGIKV